MFGLLVREPFNFSFEEISRMTPYQAQHILFCQLDNKGIPVPEVKRARNRSHRRADD